LENVKSDVPDFQTDFWRLSHRNVISSGKFVFHLLTKKIYFIVRWLIHAANIYITCLSYWVSPTATV